METLTDMISVSKEKCIVCGKKAIRLHTTGYVQACRGGGCQFVIKKAVSYTYRAIEKGVDIENMTTAERNEAFKSFDVEIGDIETTQQLEDFKTKYISIMIERVRIKKKMEEAEYNHMANFMTDEQKIEAHNNSSDPKVRKYFKRRLSLSFSDECKVFNRITYRGGKIKQNFVYDGHGNMICSSREYFKDKPQYTIDQIRQQYK
jgi:hypothetical protein